MRLSKPSLTSRIRGINQSNSIALILSSMPLWVLFGLVVFVCVLTANAGSFVSQYRLRSGVIEPEAPIATAVAAILGLLAFMLGFTFSITAERFSDRKNLIVQHANAISTCFLRTSLIPEKQKVEIRHYFREYVAIMLSLHMATQIERSLARIHEIHLLIWDQTASLVSEDMDSEMRSIFTGSVNDVINYFNARKTVSLIFRIPDVIWVSLFLLTAMSMFAYGYQNGVSGASHLIQMPLVAASFGMVVILISEMDSIGWQHFQIGYEPFLNVQEMMNKVTP